MSRYRVSRPGEQHIGNPRGLIAMWLDETEAIDLAHLYGHRDGAYDELLGAVERAYPKSDEEDAYFSSQATAERGDDAVTNPAMGI